MTLLRLAIPMLLLVQPTATPALDQLQERLEALPEALIDGKSGGMPALVAKARAGWAKAKPEVLKHIPEAEAGAIDRTFALMPTMKPREQALAALDLSGRLSRFQAPSPKQTLLQADRVAMLGWCHVDAGLWESLPEVDQAFKPIIEGDQGRHAAAVTRVQAALKRLDASARKRQAVGAKKALGELLDLVDVFEKP